MALNHQPSSLEELSVELGDDWSSKRLILEAVDEKLIKLIPYNSDYLIIISFIIIIIIELIPNTYRSVPALLTITLLPYIWNINIISRFKLHRSYAVGLGITELMSIGLILGYLGILTRLHITMAITVMFMIKWIILVYFR